MSFHSGRMPNEMNVSRRGGDPFCRIQLRRVKKDKKKQNAIVTTSAGGEQQTLVLQDYSPQNNDSTYSLVNMITPPKGSENKRWCYGGPALCFRDNRCTLCGHYVASDTQSLMNARKGCLGCMSKRCPRVLHLQCATRANMFEAGMSNGKWYCPRHRCANASTGQCFGDRVAYVSCADCT